ncbi:MAG TPA: hypothetical protein VG894_08825 [Bauldia sp.]|nr:hypothetical protein [Bauldia sp.]
MVDVTAGSLEPVDSNQTAIAWGAIVGGAVVGAAVGLLLLSLGIGFGLLSVSPSGGASPAALGTGAAIWFVIVEWVSAAFGGYIAGRLRTKWVAVHSHEVFFRDTAHGFITWALSTVIVFALGAASLSAIIGGATSAVTAVASGAAQGAAQGAATAAPDALNGASGYLTDLLFRSSPGATAAPATSATPGAPTTAAPSSPAPASTPRSEATGILLHAVAAGGLSSDDRTYLAQLVASQTGLSASDAEARVDAVMGQVQDTTTKVKETADAARKAAAAGSLLFALSLLIGAFIASVAAAIGGKERDEADALLVATGR